MVKVTFAYEWLLFSCFMCGVIGHSERECNVVDDHNQERSMGWGKNLRATPYRGVQRLVEEVEEVKACRKVLFVTKSVTEEPMQSSEEGVVRESRLLENGDEKRGEDDVEERELVRYE